MAWYVSMNGDTSDPVDDAQVIAWILGGRLLRANICLVGSKTWVDLASHPPFAAALRQAAPPPPPVGAGKDAWVERMTAVANPRVAPTSSKKPMSPTGKLVLWVLALVIVAVALPGPGLLAGLVLLGLSEYARRKQRPSFVTWVLKKPPTSTQSIGSLVIGAVMVVGGGSRVLNDWVVSMARQRDAEAVAQARAKVQSDVAAQVPAKITAWRATVAQVTAAAEATDFVGGSMPTIDGVIADATATASILGGKVPPDLTQLQSEAGDAREKYAARTEFDGLIRDVGQQVLAAQGQVKARQWLAADQAYATALQDVDSLGKAAPWLAKVLPPGFDLTVKRKEISALRSQIAGPVGAETRRADREEAARQAKEAKQAAYAAVCGEKPTVSGWDGALVGLESTLKETANDPDSIDVKNCTLPQLTSDNCWTSTCDVRGKNGFGALILKRMTFSKSALGFQEVSQ